MLLFNIGHVSGQSTIEKIGDYGLYTLPLLGFGSTIIEKDFEGSKMYAKSFTLNVALTLILKEVIKKERPNGENFKSFPSGHTSITFQSAAFLQKRYGWKYGIPAFLLAGYTGFSRVHVKKHFVEDVISGATLGVLSSYIFTQKRNIKKNKYFSFFKQGKIYSLNYTYNF